MRLPTKERAPPVPRLAWIRPLAAFVNVLLPVARVSIQLLLIDCKRMVPAFVRSGAIIRVALPKVLLPCTHKVVFGKLFVASVSLPPPIRRVVGVAGLAVTKIVLLTK